MLRGIQVGISRGVSQGAGVSPFSREGGKSEVEYGKNIAEGINDSLRTALEDFNKNIVTMFGSDFGGFLDGKKAEELTNKFIEKFNPLQESIDKLNKAISELEEKERKLAQKKDEEIGKIKADASRERSLLQGEKASVKAKAASGSLSSSDAATKLSELDARIGAVNEEEKRKIKNARSAYSRQKRKISDEREDAINQNTPLIQSNLNEATSFAQSGEVQKPITKAQEAQQREKGRQLLYDNGDFQGSAKARLRRESAQSLSNHIYAAGVERTAWGRYAGNVASFQNKMAAYANVGHSMAHVGGTMMGTKGAGLGTKALGAAFKGLGSVVKMTSGLFTKLAGPIGWIIEIVKFAADTYGEHLKFQAKLRDIGTNYINSVSSILQNGITIGTNQAQGFMTAQISKATAFVGAGSQNMTQAHGLQANLYADAVSTMVDSIYDGITTSAYKAASTAIKFGGDVSKLEHGVTARVKGAEETAGGAEKAYEYMRPVYDKQYHGIFLDLAKASGDMAIDMMKAYAEGDARAVALALLGGGDDHKGGLIGKLMSLNGSDIGLDESKGRSTAISNVSGSSNESAGSRGAMMNAVGMLSSSLRDGLMADAESKWNREKALIDMEYNLELGLLQQDATLKAQTVQAEAQLQVTRLNTEQQIADQNTEAAQKIAETYLKLAQKTEELMKKVDTATNKIGIGMGMTGEKQMRDFQHRQILKAMNVGGLWGLNPEDVFAMQQTYSEESGRSRELSETELNNIAKLGKATGDTKTAINLVTGMQIFNKSAESASNQMGIMMGKAAKIGLNIHKFSKELVDSLKLASKYNFKGGTKGLMDMAVWAQKTRFNMDSLSGIVDKIQEGGLEGVITQSAGFQVLGGHAAMNADPLGMLFDAWADPEALAKRYQDMTAGFGTFNKKTGETDFNINESMQIAQIAKLQGRSAEELRKEIMERNKMESIGKQLTSNFTDEERALLANKSVYNENTGQWTVQMKNGEYMDVSNLSASDLSDLKPQGFEENLLDAVQAIRTAAERETGATIFQQMDQISLAFDKWHNEILERIKTSMETYITNRDTYAEEINSGMELATEAYGDFSTMMQAGNKDVDAEVQKIKSTASDMAQGLSTINDIMVQGSNLLKTGLSAQDDYFNGLRALYNKMIAHIAEEAGKDLPAQNAEAVKNAIAELTGTKENQMIDPGWTNKGFEYLDAAKTALANNDYLALHKAVVDGVYSNEIRKVMKKHGLASSDEDFEGERLFETMRPFLEHVETYTAHHLDDKRYWKYKDAIVQPSQNPHLISGGKIKPINDGAITSPEDTIYAIKNDGPLGTALHSMAVAQREIADTILPISQKIMYMPSNGNFGNNGNLNVNFNGSIRVEGENGQAITLLMSELESNPIARRELTRALFRGADEMNNSGKSYYTGLSQEAGTKGGFFYG